MRRICEAILIVLLLASPAFGAPKRRAAAMPPLVAYSFDFRDGAQGWEAGFADYSPLTTNMNLIAEMRPGAFFLSGDNRSDDLFMFLRRQIAVAPNQRYVVSYTITLDSNAAAECIGAGGAPGESVYLKAGAAPVKPDAVLIDDHYRMNVDIGSQSQSGAHASVAGNIAYGPGDCSPGSGGYVTIVRTHRHPEPVQASAGGELWLLVGTDSAYEGTTALYYKRIDVQLVAVP